jgi:hypothetical protein
MTAYLLKDVVPSAVCDGIRERLGPFLQRVKPFEYPGHVLAASLYEVVEAVIRPHVGVPRHLSDAIVGMKYVQGGVVLSMNHVDRPIHRKDWDTVEIALSAILGLGGAGCTLYVEEEPFPVEKGDILIIPPDLLHRVGPVVDSPFYRIACFLCKDKA